MPKYLFVYHGGKRPETPEEGAVVMDKWIAWLSQLGADIVDGGNPARPSKTVFADRVADDGGANPVTGYSLIRARNIDDAVAKASSCPILDAGGNVEVAEAVEI